MEILSLCPKMVQRRFESSACGTRKTFVEVV